MTNETATHDVDEAVARPAKRRRVETRMPVLADGFVVHDTPTPTTATAKVVHKPAVPRFVSGFSAGDGVNEDGTIQADVGRAPGKGRDKMKGKAMVHRPPVLVAGLGASSSTSKLNNDDSVVPPEKSREKRRVGSVPHLVLNAPGTAKSAGIGNGTASHLRPAHAPPAVVLPTKTSLRQINPPTIVLPPKAPSKALQPIQPPNLPLHPAKKKELYALSTSGLGRLSDLSSQNFAESLAGILLRDQRPDLALLRLQEEKEGKDDSDLLRGLQMSPEKAGKGKWKGKGKGPAFVRGGLAAQAASFFERSSTAHILWKKDIERTAAAIHASLPAEFSARVVKILHRRAVDTSHAPCIALCQIRAQNGGPHPKYQASTLYRVVFATPTSKSTATTDKSAPSFAEGQTISIFTPYRELSTSPNASNNAPEPPRRQLAPLPLLLFTPPVPPTPDPLTAPVHSTAIICTRFQIHT